MADYEPDRRLLTIPELAKFLGISEKMIRARLQAGNFPIRHKKIGSLIRFPSSDIWAHLNTDD